MIQRYPQYLHHKDSGKGFVAQTIEHHERLAAQGYITADEFDARNAAPAAPDPAPEPEPVVAAPPPAPVEEPLSSDGEVQFHKMSAADAVARIGAESNQALIETWREIEENRPGGPRKTVLKALADALGSAVAPEPEAAVID